MDVFYSIEIILCRQVNPFNYIGLKIYTRKLEMFINSSFRLAFVGHQLVEREKTGIY